MWNFIKDTLTSFFNDVELSIVHGWPWKKSFRQTGATQPLATDVARILVVQLADIGDLVMTSAFLREVRRQFPKAKVTLIVAPLTAPLARSCPDVDEIQVFDYRSLAGTDWLKKSLGCRAWWKAARRLANREKESRPDLAFSVRQDADSVQLASHIVMASSGARWKIGYELDPVLLGTRSSQLLDIVVPRAFEGHEVARQLHLLEEAGWDVSPTASLEYWSTRETESHVEELHQTLNFSPGQQYIGIHTGSGHSLKRWPLPFFAEIASWLEKEQNYHLLFFGDESDRADAAHVIDKAGLQRGTILAGKIPLSVTATYMRRLDGFIGNDSGPFHLAVAAGIPTVGIYGPADPVRYGPWKGRSKIVTRSLPCSPCSLCCTLDSNRCLTDLPVSLVQQAIREHFAL